MMRALAMAVALVAAPAQADEVLDAVTGYMDFATENAGIILPEQITEDVFGAIHFVDARGAEQFAAGTIPGAVNIEWREVPGRLDELPDDRTVVLFCNTGVRSSQATFAARLLGHENVLVLQSGYEGWLETGAYHSQ